MDISLGIPSISDYGNIQIDASGDETVTHQNLLEKLRLKVHKCIERGNIPFVVGGSREYFASIAEACLAQPEKKTVFLSVNHTIDVKPLIESGIAH